VIGFIVSLVFWSTWGGFGGARADRGNNTTIVER
jgi:hypothetical protein